MSGPTREQVDQWAHEVFSGGARCINDALIEFAALAYAAGQAAERAKMPPAPLIVDASHIDSEALAEDIKSLKHARPVLVACTPRPDEIAAAVAAEREACASIVADSMTYLTRGEALAAIRARSQQ